MRDYELMLVLRPTLDDEAVATAVRLVSDVVERGGGAISFAGQLVDKKGNVALPRDGWKTRRLAYTINGFQDAYYAVLRFAVDATVIDEVERVLNLHEPVLRHLVTRHDGHLPAPLVEEQRPPAQAVEGAAAAAPAVDGGGAPEGVAEPIAIVPAAEADVPTVATEAPADVESAPPAASADDASSTAGAPAMDADAAPAEAAAEKAPAKARRAAAPAAKDDGDAAGDGAVPEANSEDAADSDTEDAAG
jgi:small subunit ribosomal protein S6